MADIADPSAVLDTLRNMVDQAVARRNRARLALAAHAGSRNDPWFTVEAAAERYQRACRETVDAVNALALVTDAFALTAGHLTNDHTPH